MNFTLLTIKSTQSQFKIFADYIASICHNVQDAIYYFGIFIGFIVFPIYAVILIRKHTRMKMEQLLSEISQWDPTIWSRVSSGTVFDSDKPLLWLGSLNKWQHYSRKNILSFGMPDLHAKSIQLTKAILAVCVARVHEIENMHPKKKVVFIKLLKQLKKKNNYAEIDILLNKFHVKGEKLYDLSQLIEKSGNIKNWDNFTKYLDLSSMFSVKQISFHSNYDLDNFFLTLYLYAKSEGDFNENLSKLLLSTYFRYQNVFKIYTYEIDKYIEANGLFVNKIQSLLEELPVETKEFDKFKADEEWSKFLLAFDKNPFLLIEGSPKDSYQELQRKFKEKIGYLYLNDTSENGVELLKTTKLGWEVIESLKKNKLIV